MIAGAIAALLIAAGILVYLRLEKRPDYGAWYGVAKLSGAPLDVGPVDWATLTRQGRRNDALVCPSGHCPNAMPDQEAKIYAMPPDQLLARVTDIVRAESNTRALDSASGRARFIQYTRLMRFPDTIDVEALSAANGQSTLAIYSRSLVGRKDFGVNGARVERWLTKLDTAAI
jgi:uncharacterized protein (DUF1499 family)